MGKSNSQFRVRCTVAVVDQDFVRCTVQAKVLGKWVVVGSPALVARRFSGEREVHDLYAVAAVRKIVQAGGVRVALSGHEVRVGEGVTDYRWWASPEVEGLSWCWMERAIGDGSVVLNQLL
ncbi:hypothetical protein SEA_CHEETO1_59 [Microbacterium phage Cheeto1]|nr:hypothetical protein SEA_CHEETO1_59 [Microbacterium phage Cheeto1]